MRLLLAEDDVALGSPVCKFLIHEGHAVDWAIAGKHVLGYLREFRYDCVLLDLLLPEPSGRACLAEMRAGGDETPVVVTTAIGSSVNRVSLLDAGADDYLVKPYDLLELGARVRAVVRRNQQTGEGAGQAVTRYGPLSLRANSCSVTWLDRSIALTVRELMVLEALLKRPHRAVPRQQLEAEVYGWSDPVKSNSIEVHVHHLRHKIDPKLIQTVRGQGYRLCDEERLV